MELDTRTIPVYVIDHGDLIIEALLEKVWPIVVDYASWQNYTRQQNVYGDSGTEGEVVILKKEGPGSPEWPYFARTIKIEPKRRIVWKVFTEADFFGIVDFKVDDLNGTTRFSYDLLYEYQLTAADPAELEAFRRQKEDEVAAAISTIFPSLKALAERKDGPL